ncbi:MAG: mechanosensitive ion channel family protein [Oscillospiraceae bacterium]|nr:mechanosensitive ion channel family protein [Oscillospiraceae bacterium]
MEALKATVASWATTGAKVIIALIVLLIAFKIINALARKVEKKLLAAEKLDKTLVKALTNIIKIVLKVIVVISLAGFLGIDTTGIAALVAALGVSVGLAVNGALSNFAGGALLLITRPFKIGDYISAQGYEGIVEDIRIVNTKLVTLDNKVVYLPNGALSSGSILNFSEKDLRRVDHVFSVGGNDPEKVKDIILKVCGECENVLQDPAPFARVSDYGAGNGVKVTLRAWTKTETYWDVFFDLLEKINAAFDENGIVIPFNQLDVHVKN